MRIATRYTPETVMCRPIDRTKLDRDINDNFHRNPLGKPSNVTYHTRCGMSLISEPVRAIIDDEFSGFYVDESITFAVWETETHPDGRKTGHCLPTFEVTFTLTELAPYLLPAVTLAEFTKERRGYNSRVRQNEYDWVRHFNFNKEAK